MILKREYKLLYSRFIFIEICTNKKKNLTVENMQKKINK